MAECFETVRSVGHNDSQTWYPSLTCHLVCLRNNHVSPAITRNTKVPKFVVCRHVVEHLQTCVNVSQLTVPALGLYGAGIGCGRIAMDFGSVIFFHGNGQLMIVAFAPASVSMDYGWWVYFITTNATTVSCGVVGTPDRRSEALEVVQEQ